MEKKDKKIITLSVVVSSVTILLASIVLKRSMAVNIKNKSLIVDNKILSKKLNDSYYQLGKLATENKILRNKIK